jgi:hypothetical protein
MTEAAILQELCDRLAKMPKFDRGINWQLRNWQGSEEMTVYGETANCLKWIFDNTEELISAYLATSKPVAEAVKVKRVMNDPCIAKLKDDEPFFVLLGRDPDAAHALSTWFSYRVRREGRSSKTDAAEKTLDAFRAYRDGDAPPQPEAQEANRLRRMVERRDEFIIANGLWDAFKEARRGED